LLNSLVNSCDEDHDAIRRVVQLTGWLVSMPVSMM
jgi:hypothetical protein